MNKILNINLGGYAITIDDDAYEYLKSYLESIRKRFSESEGRDEIIHDIETRLGELISQSMGTRTIVMLPDVEAATEVMGKPEDFGGEPTGGSGSSSGSSSGSGGGSSAKKGTTVRTGKRLFRDEEDTVVGGVCSGLSAYFGIHDPVWMRLIFVLLTFLSAGFWIPAYLLLWILVPPAKTAADRLAMRGEPINVDNIAKEIEDSFERLSTRVNEYGAQKKSGAGSGDRSFGTAVSAGVSVLGQMFGFVVRLFAKFGIFIAAIVAVALFIALAVSWVAGIWGLFAAAPFVDYFSPYSSGLTWLGFANAFFLLGIPVIGLCLVFVRALFKIRTPGWLSGVLGVFWFFNLITAVFLVGFAAKGYRQGGTMTKEIDLSGVRSDTLRVEAADLGRSGESYWWFDGEDGLSIEDNRLEFKGLVEIRVRKSENGQFKCTQIIRARGASTNDAVSNAEKTEFPVTVSGSTIQVPTSFGIQRGQKWRGQHVRLNIDIPVGKSIIFDNKIYRYAGAELEDYADDNDRQYISHRPEKVFRMTNRGLICSECPQFGDNDYDGDEYYEHFILEGKIDAEIRKGNDFKIKFDGPADAVQKIRTGNKLTLTTKGSSSGGTVKVYIETPVITSVYADNTGEVTIRGFEEGEASISAKGDSRIKAYIDVSSDLSVTLSGKSSLELVGKGSFLDATLSDGATLEALGWRSDRVDITASSSSKGRVYAKDDALIISDGSSEIKVEGGARIRNARYEN